MVIVLKPGETVEVTFEETDGRITVCFGTYAVTVTSDLPDTEGREGVIYEEEFHRYPPGMEPKDKIPVEEHGVRAHRQDAGPGTCSRRNTAAPAGRTGIPICILPAGHEGPHEDGDGGCWGEGFCGARVNPGVPDDSHATYCVMPTGHRGLHEDQHGGTVEPSPAAARNPTACELNRSCLLPDGHAGKCQYGSYSLQP